jgi:hypothetical protein
MMNRPTREVGPHGPKFSRQMAAARRRDAPPPSCPSSRLTPRRPSAWRRAVPSFISGTEPDHGPPAEGGGHREATVAGPAPPPPPRLAGRCTAGSPPSETRRPAGGGPSLGSSPLAPTLSHYSARVLREAKEGARRTGRRQRRTRLPWPSPRERKERKPEKREETGEKKTIN